MDTGKGKLVEFNDAIELQKLQKKHPNHGGWFTVGEELEIRGSQFRIKSVKPTEIRLKLLKRK